MGGRRAQSARGRSPSSRFASASSAQHAGAASEDFSASRVTLRVTGRSVNVDPRIVRRASTNAVGSHCAGILSVRTRGYDALYALPRCATAHGGACRAGKSSVWWPGLSEAQASDLPELGWFPRDVAGLKAWREHFKAHVKEHPYLSACAFLSTYSFVCPTAGQP